MSIADLFIEHVGTTTLNLVPSNDLTLSDRLELVTGFIATLLQQPKTFSFGSHNKHAFFFWTYWSIGTGLAIGWE